MERVIHTWNRWMSPKVVRLRLTADALTVTIAADQLHFNATLNFSMTQNDLRTAMNRQHEKRNGKIFSTFLNMLTTRRFSKSYQLHVSFV